MMWMFCGVLVFFPYAFGSPDSNSSKYQLKEKTTLAPDEVMRQILIKHGISPYSTPSHSNTRSKPPSTTSTTPSSVDNIMEQLYQQHGAASSSSLPSRKQASSSIKSTTSRNDGEPSSVKNTSNQYKASSSSSSMDKILQQHDSSPPSSSSTVDKADGHISMNKVYQQHSAPSQTMQHIMHQHTVQQPRPSSKPTAKPSTSVTFFMQPLLKQLSPVGAGLGVILAPLLLLNGIFSFFGGLENFFSNFIQTMYKPPRIYGPMQGQGANFRPFPSHNAALLKRQPRMGDFQLVEEIEDFMEMLLKALENLQD